VGKADGKSAQASPPGCVQSRGAPVGLTALADLGFWLVQSVLTGSPTNYSAYGREHLPGYRLMREGAAF
jgi:hypothetical protein